VLELELVLPDSAEDALHARDGVTQRGGQPCRDGAHRYIAAYIAGKASELVNGIDGRSDRVDLEDRGWRRG
jgi:hypothetical protein